MPSPTASSPGALFIVATPIGNRADISERAIRILQEATLILAEDTRHSRLLLEPLGIRTPVKAYHAHNENIISAQIIKQLQAGATIALISDAGTPLISDPGYPLVHLARSLNIPVHPIPGPSALIAALSAAGISCDTFTFAGFLPTKSAARTSRLQEFAQFNHTLVFYETGRRLPATINDIITVFGTDPAIVIARELTKLHEEFLTGTPAAILEALKDKPERQKGELVLIIKPAPVHDKDNKILEILLDELPLKQSVNLAHKITGIKKNQLYQAALQLTAGHPE